MTYPFPVPVGTPRVAARMTPEEEDIYYETHAEPVPRWIGALFGFALRLVALSASRRTDRRGHAPPARPCHET